VAGVRPLRGLPPTTIPGARRAFKDDLATFVEAVKQFHQPAVVGVVQLGRERLRVKPQSYRRRRERYVTVVDLGCLPSFTGPTLGLSCWSRTARAEAGRVLAA
jgi:hypothetical protein